MCLEEWTPSPKTCSCYTTALHRPIPHNDQICIYIFLFPFSLTWFKYLWVWVVFEDNAPVHDMVIGDKTGTMKVALWHECLKTPIKTGQTVKVTNCTAGEYRNNLVLSRTVKRKVMVSYQILKCYSVMPHHARSLSNWKGINAINIIKVD